MDRKEERAPLESAKVRSRLTLLVAVFIVGFLAFCLLTRNSMRLVQVHGPIYNRIILNKDLIADILPPPEYLIESYLLVLQTLDEPDPVYWRALNERLGRLRALYEERHGFWTRTLEPGTLRQILLVGSYEPAMQFYRVVDEALVPALERGDRETARVLARGVLKQHYEVHRAAIDQVVLLAMERAEMSEQEASVLIRQRTMLLLALGGASCAFVGVLGTMIARQVVAANRALEHEVAERQRAREDLHSSEERRFEAMRQGDRLKSALLMSVSHDLRTPLAAIRLSAASMHESGSVEKRQELLEGINLKIEHLGRLVDNLLDMSRIESGALTPRREWHLLEEIVEGTLRRMDSAADGRQLELALSPDLPPIFVDEVLLQHVLVNLLDNAIKYSPMGSLIRLSALHRDGALEVQVENAGAEIPSAELERVFEPFYRGGRHENGSGIPGTGLGLAICRGIVEAHQGWIRAESSNGITAIRFALPRIAEMPPLSL